MDKLKKKPISWKIALKKLRGKNFHIIKGDEDKKNYSNDVWHRNKRDSRKKYDEAYGLSWWHFWISLFCYRPVIVSSSVLFNYNIFLCL